MNGIRVFTLALLASWCRAEELVSVRGMVESDQPVRMTELTIELETLDNMGMRSQSHVGGDGTFEFQVAAGRYRLRVTDPRGAPVREQLVDITQSAPLAVRLPGERAERPVSGTVSVGRLRTPVPAKALRKFVEAQRESEQGRYNQAAAKLEEALRIFPQYYEARSNLGVQYTRLGRREDALREFELAAASEPSAVVLTNLSYTYLTSRRLEEARNTARRAIEIDGAAYFAHYLLGIMLAEAGQTIEAEKHLLLGARVAPSAHVALAKLYFTGSKNAAAERELERYLKTGDKRFRSEIESWFASRSRSRGFPAPAE